MPEFVVWSARSNKAVRFAFVQPENSVVPRAASGSEPAVATTISVSANVVVTLLTEPAVVAACVLVPYTSHGSPLVMTPLYEMIRPCWWSPESLVVGLPSLPFQRRQKNQRCVVESSSLNYLYNQYITFRRAYFVKHIHTTYSVMKILGG